MSKGDVKLSVGLETKDVEKQAKQLSDMIDKTLNKAGNGKQSAQTASRVADLKKVKAEYEAVRAEMDKIANQKIPTEKYKALSAEASALKQRLQEIQPAILKDTEALGRTLRLMQNLANQKTPTDDFVFLEKEITKAEKKLSDLVARRDKMLATGGRNTENSTSFKKLTYDIEQATKALGVLKEEKRDMEASGEAFTLGKDTAEYAKLNQEAEQYKANIQGAVNEQSKVEQSLTNIASKMYQMRAGGTAFTDGTQTAEYENVKQKLQSIIDKMKIKIMREQESNRKVAEQHPLLARIAAGIKGVTSKLKESQKHTDKMSDGFKRGLKNVLKYAFGIRSTFILVRKLRSAIGEGFGNLMKDRPTSALAKDIQDIKNSLATLKNAFAAAFAPIVTMALPYVKQLLNYILSAINTLGQFIGAITGQKTYTKAIKQNTAAMNENTAAAKKNQSQLGKFDEINNLSDQKDSGGGGGGGAGAMFEDVAIDSKIADVANKVKDVLTQIAEPVKQAWANVGDYVQTSWSNAFTNVKKLAEDVGRDALTVWNQPQSVTVFENIFKIIGNIGQIVAGLAGQFRIAWNENNTGLHILEGIRDVFGIIVDFVQRVTSSTAEWAQTLDFTPLLTSIQGLLVDVQAFLQPVADIFVDLWNNVLLPLASYVIEESLPTGIELLGAAFDLVGAALEVIEPFINPIIDFFSTLLGFAWETYQSVLESIIDLVHNLADLLRGDKSFKEFVDELSPFQTLLVAVATAIGLVSAALGIYNAVGAIWTAVTGAMTVAGSALAAVIAFITSPIGLAIVAITALVAAGLLLVKNWDKLPDGVKKVFEGIWNFIKFIINAILGGVEGLANGVINGVNFVIKALNKLNIDVPDWVPGIGGEKFGFNIPELSKVSIPRLATGQVVPPNASEYLAILGDNNKETEVVSPLSTMKQAMIEALQSVNFGGTDDRPVIVQIDGKEVFKAVRTQSKQYTKATGNNAFA